MNKVSLTGRLTKDIELRYTNNNIENCTFTIASNRPIKDSNGNYVADFIQCVAWRQPANFLSKYAFKGDLIGIEGQIQSRSYENNKKEKVYITEVLCDRVEILAKKNNNQSLEDKAKEFAKDNNVEFANETFEISADGLPWE